MNITFLLNGETVELTAVEPTRSVLDWLREERGLKGTKEGCNEGDCGACSVMVADAQGVRALNACLLMLGQMQGKALITVEGLSGPEGEQHPVQKALVEYHGSQCGFCTPGFATTLAAGHLNGEEDFDTLLAGNLCRCTGYAPIIRAAKAAMADPVPDWLNATRMGKGPTASKEVAPAMPGSADALATLLMQKPHATLVAGGTDVGLWLTKGLKDLHDVIFLSGVSDLGGVVVDEDGIHLGSGLTIEGFRKAISDLHPHFAAMLKRFASAQIRGAATLGGNIANGSPIGDTPPPLIALNARLHLRRGEARRNIPLEDYFVAYGRQDLVAGEFIEGITIPRQPDRLKVYKVSKRFDQDISAVLGAFSIVVENGMVQSARIAFGGMAATPSRAVEVEKSLLGQQWSRETITAATASFATDFSPISDVRASSEYRLEIARNMLTRVWLEDQGEVVSVREVSA